MKRSEICEEGSPLRRCRERPWPGGSLDSHVPPEPWVDYYVELESGEIIEGTVYLDD